MDYITLLSILLLAVLVATLFFAFMWRKQRNDSVRQVKMLAQRLLDIEKNQQEIHTLLADEHKVSSPREQVDLSGMNDEELFQHITSVIKTEKLYCWPDFNRAAVMEQFSLSAARIGAAFAKGGGQSLPEFVRNCRLDHACRLMVEQPRLPFSEVSTASGYQRTTTFYHDFKARFGMGPTEFREKELRVKN